MSGSTHCEACEAGTYGPEAAASACIMCNAGTFSPAVNASSKDVCIECQAGKASARPGQGRPSSCSWCGTDSYSLAGATSCSVCPPYSTSLPQSISRFDCRCHAGFSGAHGGPCLKCVGGTFKDIVGSSECISCGQGRYSSSTTASTGCVRCPFESDSPAGSDRITDCTCNSGYSGADGTPCGACLAGTYKEERGSANCTACGAGFYSPVAGASLATDCMPCPVGKYSRKMIAEFEGECYDCEPGTYSELVGSRQCDDCPAGKFLSEAGSNNSLDCTNCTLQFCGVGNYRTLCSAGSVRDSFCANCTLKTNFSMFVGHGEYNDTCDWVCIPPYKVRGPFIAYRGLLTGVAHTRQGMRVPL
jgi:hypothetical protein